MNKKNSGFSLVELIVVIAIMAVLVGVLAPAYLKYVEKSRKSTDVSALADIINASSSIAADVQFDLPADSEFRVTGASGKLNLAVYANDAALNTEADSGSTSEWKSVAKCENGYSLKSKEFQKLAPADGASDSIKGIVQDNGSVDWVRPNRAGEGLFATMIKYSEKDLGSKFATASN